MEKLLNASQIYKWQPARMSHEELATDINKSTWMFRCTMMINQASAEGN